MTTLSPRTVTALALALAVTLSLVAPAPAPAADPVKIGVLAPLTGV